MHNSIVEYYVFLTGKQDSFCKYFSKILHLSLREKYFWVTFTHTMKAIQRKEWCYVCNKLWLGLIGIRSCNKPNIFSTDCLMNQL